MITNSSNNISPIHRKEFRKLHNCSINTILDHKHFSVVQLYCEFYSYFTSAAFYEIVIYSAKVDNIQMDKNSDEVGSKSSKVPNGVDARGKLA